MEGGGKLEREDQNLTDGGVFIMDGMLAAGCWLLVAGCSLRRH